MNWTLHLGDCRDVLATVPDASIDAVVTDPPYGLGKAPDALAMLRDWLDTGHYDVKGRGFMGREWDAFVPQPVLWREVYRVMKPGAHLVAFASTRTQDLMGLALRLAGFEIRDCLSWLYGTGFSKSWNFKTMFPGEWCACGHGGNPVPYSHELNMHSLREGLLRDPKSSAASERADVLQAMQRSEQGSGLGEARTQGFGCEKPSEGSRDGRAPERGEQPLLEGRELHRAKEGISTDSQPDAPTSESKRLCSGAHRSSGKDAGSTSDAVRGGTPHQPQQVRQPTGESAHLRESPGTLDDGALRNGGCCARCGKLSSHYQGVGTGLKPAWEPIILARKPLIGTVVANVQAHGTGGLNIDACRIESSTPTATFERHAGDRNRERYRTGTTGERSQSAQGRWPANVCLDEIAAAMLDAEVGETVTGAWDGFRNTPKTGGIYGEFAQVGDTSRARPADRGGPSRFFYIAKASPSERELEDGSRSSHPTVKPIDLMRWLVRLVTPPGGMVLDPFAGSGSTGVACAEEGFDFIGVERETEYHAIAFARIAAATRQGRLAL